MWVRQMNSHNVKAARSVIICGDFNVHVDDHDDTQAARLSQLVQMFDCVQHRNTSTSRRTVTVIHSTSSSH